MHNLIYSILKVSQIPEDIHIKLIRERMKLRNSRVTHNYVMKGKWLIPNR